MTLPAWLAYLIVVGVALTCTFVGAFLGSLAGIDWYSAAACEISSGSAPTLPAPSSATSGKLDAEL